ncbi:MAG: hypothetical protein APR63_00560 [Desulfuromonas sp. SDB]|nr:MAG: hypothetical protein APR63_00560 [Desulfuromonas sp. SDB]
MSDLKTIKIYCLNCRTLLYRYYKRGKGSLVKCYVDRIKNDYTAGDLRCPNCGIEFAKPRMIHGKPAYKIIGGKVFIKS